MSILTRLDAHEKLVRRMSERNGADLAVAAISGVITPGEYRNAVFSCTACAEPEACEEFLRRSGAGVPDYCRNADLIARVAEQFPDGL